MEEEKEDFVTNLDISWNTSVYILCMEVQANLLTGCFVNVQNEGVYNNACHEGKMPLISMSTWHPRTWSPTSSSGENEYCVSETAQNMERLTWLHMSTGKSKDVILLMAKGDGAVFCVNREKRECCHCEGQGHTMQSHAGSTAVFPAASNVDPWLEPTAQPQRSVCTCI